MSSGLGMSLDDYIKASKSKNRENNNFGGYKPKNSGGNFRKFRKFNQPQGNYNNRFKRDENYENKFNQVFFIHFKSMSFSHSLEKKLGT